MTRAPGSSAENSSSEPVACLRCFGERGLRTRPLSIFSNKKRAPTETELKSPVRMWPLLMLLICFVSTGHAFAMPQNDLRSRALALEQQGEDMEAEEAWHDILTSNPQNAEALAHLGLLEARQRHYDSAINYDRKALAINPNLPGVRMNLGLALFKTSQFSAAAQAFKAQLSQDPSDQRLTILLAMSYYGMADYAAAIPYLKDAAAKDPQNLSLRLTLAHSCLWAKQFTCVMEVYRQILSLNAESAEADMLAGEAMDGQGNTNGAIEQFRAAERANTNEPNVHFGLGYLLWKQREYPEAKKEFEAELSSDPHHGQARAYLGDVLVRENDYASAESQLKRAIAADPSLPLTYLDLGIIYASSGRNSEAIAAFQKATALAPNDADSHWRLARLYQSMGRTQEARIEFAKVSAIKKDQNQNSKPPALDIR